MLTVKYYRARDTERDLKMEAANVACKVADVRVPWEIEAYFKEGLEIKTVVPLQMLAGRKGEYELSLAVAPAEAVTMSINVDEIRDEVIKDLRKKIAVFGPMSFEELLAHYEEVSGDANS